ncbi:CIC11C00000002330 [Sungouiella intermedia]|uniref:CIC11C00000002330 n=1 Tax=Sungouiella intermedia TaxID=45354 RepID=A0A1L0CXW8_9ASCO|nr:CIC11C00000002330 [[Candida] intermedia]
MSAPPEPTVETPAEDTPMADSEVDTKESSDANTAGPVDSADHDAPNTETAPTNQEAAAKDESKEPEPVDLEKLKATFQEKAKTYLIEQSRHVVIPSFAKWFNMNDVHSIEKKLFPDFFPVKTLDDTPKSVYKTPEVYQNMRDFMINTYRLNPIEYLTVTAVRRNLAGDVASIIRIHRFLEKWGLINYQIDPRTKPSLVGPQYTGHFQITLDTPKGLTPLVPEELEVVSKKTSTAVPTSEPKQVETPKIKEEDEDNLVIPLNLEITSNIFEESGSKSAVSSIQYFCNETSNDISNIRYHNLKSKGVTGNFGPLEISKDVFEQGLFPLNFTSSDFVKLEKSFKNTEWSQQEVLLLLEGIEMYATVDSNPLSLFINSNGQWDRISEHVALKSREECLVKFLQLPIEDKYLHALIKPETKDSLDQNLDKDTIIQEVVAKLIKSNEGKELLDKSAKSGLEDAVLNQTNLINQVIELTLEKVDAKLKLINHLEADLVKTENLLNLQRKQVLIERWLNFEKLSKFKKENNNPELTPLLDDLLTPININEINKSFNKINLDASSDNPTPEVSEQAEEEVLPISVTQPKSYQFWSA